MSLDVSLTGEVEEKCFNCGQIHTFKREIYSANITHNLGEMARAAGLYKALWRPKEIGGFCGSDIVDDLAEGLKRLKEDPEKYKKYNAKNGWGLYKHFVPFVEKYLEACIKNPDAFIEADV